MRCAPIQSTMASVQDEEITTATMSLVEEEEDLSDDQIQALLKEAEERLRLQSSLSRGQSQNSTEENIKTNIPHLDTRTDSSLKPCLKLTKGAAQVDSDYVRKQADPQGNAAQIKSLETASAKKQRLKEVSLMRLLFFSVIVTSLTLNTRRKKQLRDPNGSTCRRQFSPQNSNVISNSCDFVLSWTPSDTTRRKIAERSHLLILRLERSLRARQSISVRD